MADLLGEYSDRPLVVSLKAMPDVRRTEDVVRQVARALLLWESMHPGPVVFLSMSRQSDYGLGALWSDRRLAERVVAAAGLARPPLIIGPNLEPRMAKGVTGVARKVLAMRLHAQISASHAVHLFWVCSLSRRASPGCGLTQWLRCRRLIFVLTSSWRCSMPSSGPHTPALPMVESCAKER